MVIDRPRLTMIAKEDFGIQSGKNAPHIKYFLPDLGTKRDARKIQV